MIADKAPRVTRPQMNLGPMLESDLTPGKQEHGSISMFRDQILHKTALIMKE
jgi:hypothetical protein